MKQVMSKELKHYNYLHSELEAVYHNMAFNLGLSDSTMRILYTLCNNEYRCRLQDICLLSGISKQTVNSAIRKLEAMNIVYLENIGAKSKLVCLTESGISLAKQTALKMIEAENSVFADWSERDIKRYLDLTERFLNEFKEKSKLAYAKKQE
ncbi:MarR family transcriptional regulator [Eubacteriales bacterium OttesenSCG-928-G02]|nr:MarR family transcriptional regulator [Eubacteriales bacterium OttesenSCG-928-G02]